MWRIKLHSGDSGSKLVTGKGRMARAWVMPVRQPVGATVVINRMIACFHWCKQTEFDLLRIVLTWEVLISGSRTRAFSC